MPYFTDKSSEGKRVAHAKLNRVLPSDAELKVWLNQLNTYVVPDETAKKINDNISKNNSNSNQQKSTNKNQRKTNNKNQNQQDSEEELEASDFIKNTFAGRAVLMEKFRNFMDETVQTVSTQYGHAMVIAELTAWRSWLADPLKFSGDDEETEVEEKSAAGTHSISTTTTTNTNNSNKSATRRTRGKNNDQLPVPEKRSVSPPKSSTNKKNKNNNSNLLVDTSGNSNQNQNTNQNQNSNNNKSSSNTGEDETDKKFTYYNSNLVETSNRRGAKYFTFKSISDNDTPGNFKVNVTLNFNILTTGIYHLMKYAAVHTTYFPADERVCVLPPALTEVLIFYRQHVLQYLVGKSVEVGDSNLLWGFTNELKNIYEMNLKLHMLNLPIYVSRVFVALYSADGTLSKDLAKKIIKWKLNDIWFENKKKENENNNNNNNKDDEDDWKYWKPDAVNHKDAIEKANEFCIRFKIDKFPLPKNYEKVDENNINKLLSVSFELLEAAKMHNSLIEKRLAELEKTETQEKRPTSSSTATATTSTSSTTASSSSSSSSSTITTESKKMLLSKLIIIWNALPQKSGSHLINISFNNTTIKNFFRKFLQKEYSCRFKSSVVSKSNHKYSHCKTAEEKTKAKKKSQEESEEQKKKEHEWCWKFFNVNVLIDEKNESYSKNENKFSVEFANSFRTDGCSISVLFADVKPSFQQEIKREANLVQAIIDNNDSGGGGENTNNAENNNNLPEDVAAEATLEAVERQLNNNNNSNFSNASALIAGAQLHSDSSSNNNNAPGNLSSSSEDDDDSDDNHENYLRTCEIVRKNRDENRRYKKSDSDLDNLNNDDEAFLLDDDEEEEDDDEDVDSKNLFRCDLDEIMDFFLDNQKESEEEPDTSKVKLCQGGDPGKWECTFSAATIERDEHTGRLLKTTSGEYFKPKILFDLGKHWKHIPGKVLTSQQQGRLDAFRTRGSAVLNFNKAHHEAGMRARNNWYENLLEKNSNFQTLQEISLAASEKEKECRATLLQQLQNNNSPMNNVSPTQNANKNKTQQNQRTVSHAQQVFFLLDNFRSINNHQQREQYYDELLKPRYVTSRVRHMLILLQREHGFRNWRFRVWSKYRSEYQRFAESLMYHPCTGERLKKEEVFIGLGNWNGKGSKGRFSCKGSLKTLYRCLSEVALTTYVDEWRSSKQCFYGCLGNMVNLYPTLTSLAYSLAAKEEHDVNQAIKQSEKLNEAVPDNKNKKKI